MIIKKTAILVLILTILGTAFGDAGKQMFSKELLSAAGLKNVWESRISLIAGEEISEIWETDNSLFLLSSSNYLTCLDKSAGDMKFGLEIAPIGVPIFEPCFADGMISFVAGNTVINIDSELGTVKDRFPLEYTAVTGLVRSGNYDFIASAENIIYAVRWQDKLPIYKVSADNSSKITSIAATNNGNVVFTTEKGNIVCFEAADKRKQWQYNAVSKITAPVAIADGFVYVSGEDTNIYKISQFTGKLDWKFWAQGSMDKSASIGNNTIYQYVRDMGLYGIDKATGKKLYLIEDGINIMSEKGDLAYVFADNGMLKVANNSTGEIIKTVNFFPAEYFAANTANSRIYTADKSGKIVCLEIID